jgi:hypothetical protein
MRDLIGITYDSASGGPELTATEWRQTETSLFVRNATDVVMGGVRGGAVSNSGSSVTIAPLTVVVQTQWSLGVYRAAFPGGSSELSKTLAAAHATLSRIDALDIKIYDHEADGSGLRGADIVLTTGTPGSGSAPAFTGVGIRLGTFNVPASGGGSPAFTQDTNLTGYAAAGGILDVAGRPTNVRSGTIIHNRATGALEQYYSGTWRTIFNAVWTNWVPGWTGITQNPQRGNGVEAGAYRISGGMVDAFWKYTYGTAFVVGVGFWAWTMPVAAHADWAIAPIGRTAFNDVSAAACLTRQAVTLGQPASFAAVSEAGVRLGPAGPVPDVGDTLAITLRYRPATEAP